jgi:hypothetical protein
MSSPSGLTDREAAIDAVLHFVEGLDDGDASLVRSARSPKMPLSTSRPSATLASHSPSSVYRDTIVDKLLKSVGPLDSTHHVSNFRVNMTGASATLTCYAH